MAHHHQIQFVTKIANEYPLNFKDSRVLEVGSLNINGSVRDFFTDCIYLGLDVAEGPGVDLACEGQNFNAPENTYDTVVSCECFEHNPYWKETFINMVRLCKPGGIVLFTCATEGRGEHGTSNNGPCCSPLTVDLGWEYYKNLTENDFRELDLDYDNIFSSHEFTVEEDVRDLYFIGVKR